MHTTPSSPRSRSARCTDLPPRGCTTAGSLLAELERSPGSTSTRCSATTIHGRRLCFEAGVAPDAIRPIGALLAKLYDAFAGEEAILVEVNPRVVLKDRSVIALDAKVTLDDNSFYRHPLNAELRNAGAEDEHEAMARERGLTYVKLDGNIGSLGNGAGLVMSTLDVVAQAGGRPANFHAGGGSKADAITSAVEVILSDPKVTAVCSTSSRDHPLRRGCQGSHRGVLVVEARLPVVVRLDASPAARAPSTR